MTIEQVSAPSRDLFNKGLTLLERGNLDYAVDLLTRSVEMCPEFLQARRYLRIAEVQRFKRQRPGAVGQALSLLKGLPSYVQAQAALKSGRFSAALSHVERLLALEPLNKGYVRLFADVADGMGFPEAAVQTLEVYRENFPQDPEILLLLGEIYMELQQARQAQECFERLNIIKPNDPSVLRALKNAMALVSLTRDGWEVAAAKGSSYQDLIKNKKEASTLEKESKAVKDENDVEALIAATKSRLATEPGNVNNYRQLARLYTQKHSYEEAIGVLRQAIGMNPGDPELDGALSAIMIQQFDHQIMVLREAGSEEDAGRLLSERERFVHEDLLQRVERYPNDLRLRYELGLVLYQRQQTDQAIQQFQLAQKNIRHRSMALYYLGRCFRDKRQYDMAREQLEKAVMEMIVLDDDKKEVLYQLGEVCEIVGDSAKAMEHFKQIYQVDIGFKDIASKVERGYR